MCQDKTDAPIKFSVFCELWAKLVKILRPLADCFLSEQQQPLKIRLPIVDILNGGLTRRSGLSKQRLHTLEAHTVSWNQFLGNNMILCCGILVHAQVWNVILVNVLGMTLLSEIISYRVVGGVCVGDSCNVWHLLHLCNWSVLLWIVLIFIYATLGIMHCLLLAILSR